MQQELSRFCCQLQQDGSLQVWTEVFPWERLHHKSRRAAHSDLLRVATALNLLCAVGAVMPVWEAAAWRAARLCVTEALVIALLPTCTRYSTILRQGLQVLSVRDLSGSL